MGGVAIIQNRRQFLTTLSLAGAASFVRAPPSAAAEGSLETTSVRIVKIPGICVAPQYVAGELLRAEGFTDVRCVDAWPTREFPEQVGHGEADFTLAFAAALVQAIDAGERSRLWAACMSAATNCSPERRSAASET